MLSRNAVLRPWLVVGVVLGLAGLGGLAAADPDPDAKFVDDAAWMANVELNRYYEIYYEKTCGLHHAGPWVDVANAVIKRGKGRTANVRWEGTTADGLEYA